MTNPSAATAISAAVRDTALFTPEATPAQLLPTAFITVVASGATLMVMPKPSMTTEGKKVAQ